MQHQTHCCYNLSVFLSDTHRRSSRVFLACVVTREWIRPTQPEETIIMIITTTTNTRTQACVTNIKGMHCHEHVITAVRYRCCPDLNVRDWPQLAHESRRILSETQVARRVASIPATMYMPKPRHGNGVGVFVKRPKTTRRR